MTIETFDAFIKAYRKNRNNIKRNIDEIRRLLTDIIQLWCFRKASGCVFQTEKARDFGI